MGKQKTNKKARVQPRPKKKKMKVVAKQSIGTSVMDQLRDVSKVFMSVVKNKEGIQRAIQENVEQVMSYFKTYDAIQLLGGVGLHLLQNIPSVEKEYESKILGKDIKLDEDAEVIAEYALNYGTAYDVKGLPSPPKSVIADLVSKLGQLSNYYTFLDLPDTDDSLEIVQWMIHSQYIHTRGNGYQRHVEEIYKELFAPHASFIKTHYDFSVDALFRVLTAIELRIISKLRGDEIQEATGMHAYWARWREWEEANNRSIENIKDISGMDFTYGPATEFMKANPDVFMDGQPQAYSYYEYQHSDTIFWIYPINEEDKKVLDSLSVPFGSNASFVAPGEYQGNIMNGKRIYEKPLIKTGEKYYCFSPMLLHRNLFVITENLLKIDNAYYNSRYLGNAHPECRDNYIERKVKSLFERMLPDATFYSSVKYRAEGVKTEMDVLGVSDKATYLIEVKAHELTHSDNVGIKGTMAKFNNSIGEACYQSNRAAIYVRETADPVFTQTANTIHIDKTKPIYKIAITFQHYSALMGMMDELVGCGMMKEEYIDTWIASIFDLMVFADKITSEEQFIKYLNMHKMVYAKHFKYVDELDLLGGFLYHDLEKSVRRKSGGIIMGLKKEIDETYESVI